MPASDLLKKEMILNMGPQHPSTHGVFRVILTLDGETVTDCIPVIGYLHRGTEKLSELRNYTQVIPFTDRLDYLAPLSNNFAYVLSAEKLGGIDVPEYVQYVRTILVELQRIASHCVAIGTFAADAGTFFTPLLYMLRERELILDLWEEVAGQRFNPSYFRIGGLSRPVTETFTERVQHIVNIMPRSIDEYESLLTTNEIFTVRTRHVGVLPAEMAINASCTGPILRASGIKYDIRKVEPYGIYDRFDFDIPTGVNGDCYDRYMVRIQEMRESTKIVAQALKDLPSPTHSVTDDQGKTTEISDHITANKKIKNFKPPVGESYVRIEAPKGELGFYLVSDGTNNPYRFRIRAPSFINLAVLSDLLIGHKIGDVVVILGSLDIVLGEVDR